MKAARKTACQNNSNTDNQVVHNDISTSRSVKISSNSTVNFADTDSFTVNYNF